MLRMYCKEPYMIKKNSTDTIVPKRTFGDTGVKIFKLCLLPYARLKNLRIKCRIGDGRAPAYH